MSHAAIAASSWHLDDLFQHLSGVDQQHDGLVEVEHAVVHARMVNARHRALHEQHGLRLVHIEHRHAIYGRGNFADSRCRDYPDFCFPSGAGGLVSEPVLRTVSNIRGGSCEVSSGAIFRDILEFARLFSPIKGARVDSTNSKATS